MNQIEFNFQREGLSPLSADQLVSIRRSINSKWKGMARRAHYQDMNEAVGIALRATGLSDDEKRDFAINVSRSLHYPRPTSRDMSVDHICRIAGVPPEKIKTHRL